MTTSYLRKKNLARLCGKCGQYFDPSIKFCPEDGNKLSDTAMTNRAVAQLSQTRLPAAEQPPSDEPFVVPDNVPSLGGLKPDETTVEGLPLGPEAEQSEALVGTILDGHYEIESVVGQGGMGVVYKAHHLLMKKTVAVKSVLPHLVLHPTSIERFRQEAQASSNLAHPNIVTIHHFGITSSGRPYLVMDYLEGMSLAALIRRNKYLSVGTACHIFAQIANGLSHAHKHGVIHRDLKPTNVLLVDHSGEPMHVQIVDFGIAKLLPQAGQEALNLTQTGELFGSPLYMSPEQCKGDKLDARSDIYSLGCLMYEALAGEPPLVGDNTLEVLYKHVNDVPAPISAHGVSVPHKLEAIVFKCLAKKPDNRYQTMDDLRRDLLEILRRDASMFSKVVSRWELFVLRRKPRSKRDRLLVLAETFLLVTVLGLGACLFSLEMRAKDSQASKLKFVWPSDVPQPSAMADTRDEFQYQDLTSGSKGYFEKRLDVPRSVDLMQRLDVFGDRMSEKHCWDLCSDAYALSWKINSDFNGPYAMTTLIALAKYANSLHDKGDDAEAINLYLNLDDKTRAELKRYPYSHAFLYERAGDCLYRLGNYEAAAREYTAALAALPNLKGFPDELKVGINLAPRAEFADMQGHLADCVHEIARHKSGALPAAAKQAYDAEIIYLDANGLWKQLRSSASNETMVALVKRARNERLLARADRDSSFFALLKQRQSAACGAKNWSDQTDATYKEAIDVARSLYGRNSGYVGLLTREYSEFLMERQDYIKALFMRVCAWTILADSK